MPNFTTAGWLWEATCREVSSSGISVVMRTALSHFRSLCVGKHGEMCTPSLPTHPSQSCGCSWSKESCSPTLLIPCAAAEVANPAVPLLGKTVVLHISDDADSQEPVCATQKFLLSDPYWWQIVFDNVQHHRSFCIILSNFMQQAPNSRTLITHC